MNKWDYIRSISQRGSHYGYNGGVFDLLIWSKKDNTLSVTLAEAKAFWENWPQVLASDCGFLQNAGSTKSAS